MSKKQEKKLKFIEPSENGIGVWVWEHFSYPRDSVLSGRDGRRRVAHFDSVELAKKAHPEAVVCEYASSHEANREDMRSFARSLPPPDFDSEIAGEDW